MEENRRSIIPGWIWAVMAVAIVALTLALFMTDRRKEPGPALVYDVSEYEAVDQKDIGYDEVLRIPLDLDDPAGIAVIGAETLLVAGDRLLLSLDSSGAERSRRNLDFQPGCVTAAPDGVVYLGARDFVAALPDMTGDCVRWTPLGEKAWLTAITADERYVYAADAGNKRVLQYDRTGTLLREIGGYNDPQDAWRFIVPSPYFDVALDPQGALWIVNPGKLGAENYREDGTLLSAWHQPGMALDKFSGCCNPIHIAFKRDNSLVSAEKGLNRVKAYNADRSFAGVVASPESMNAGWTVAGDAIDHAPIRDLAVDAKDRILVLHGPLKSLLVFEEAPR